MANICPVCGFKGLKKPPYTGKNGIPHLVADGQGNPSYEICVSCGFQFGVTDYDKKISHEQWRQKWMANGMQWRATSIQSPNGWNPREQLQNLGINIL